VATTFVRLLPREGRDRRTLTLAAPRCYSLSVVYAIIETGGKQYKVSEGDVIRTDLVDAKPGSRVTFDRVVMAGGDDVIFGTPFIKGAKVAGSVVRQARGEKILVFRYKPKKRVRKLIGHRQRFAEVKIEKISLP